MANGLGRPHRRERDNLPDPTGQPCPFCERPMWPKTEALDADHSVPRALGGGGALRWSHAKCNRSAGPKLRDQLRGLTPKTQPWESRWA